MTSRARGPWILALALVGCQGPRGEPLEICLHEASGVPLGRACDVDGVYDPTMCVAGGVCFHGYCAAICEADDACEAGSCHHDADDAPGACSEPCDPKDLGEPPPFLDPEQARCDDGFWGYDMPRVCFNGGDPSVTD